MHSWDGEPAGLDTGVWVRAEPAQADGPGIGLRALPGPRFQAEATDAQEPGNEGGTRSLDLSPKQAAKPSDAKPLGPFSELRAGLDQKGEGVPCGKRGSAALGLWMKPLQMGVLPGLLVDWGEVGGCSASLPGAPRTVGGVLQEGWQVGRGSWWSGDRVCWWGCSDVALQGLVSVGWGKGGGWQALGQRTPGKVVVPQRPGPAWTGQWSSQSVGRSRGHCGAGRVAGEREGVQRPRARRGLGTPEWEGGKAPELFCRVG